MFCAYTQSKKKKQTQFGLQHFVPPYPPSSIFSIARLLSLFLEYYVYFKQSPFFLLSYEQLLGKRSPSEWRFHLGRERIP